ncbi:rhodanese-like domain-containing protein [Tamlana fucoidanivorans]|uniref:Rhodanese-like domain-containing protein n=1 Tax=Allotamlana fucoidanivorans TaxID=2583814 RepID=A0A5C4SH18_9FLAO|nr:rhodanese-like domain-containing protein [Tamlana fucoidanivorans]TNJ42939.1 rhodanese-like domain-containing protein [Tamlana fucoidanivorans]
MNKKNIAKILSFRYMLMATVLIILAGGLLLLPKHQKQEGITSETLLSHAISNERYISTDQISHKIINGDPSFILVDVRDEKSYQTYSLPNAINIPLPELFKDAHLEYINQDQFDVVFFSNDNFHADQAWLLCDRLGFKNLRVLQGGLNTWFTTIINPSIPSEDQPLEDFERYKTRKAASMYFGVTYPDQDIDNNLTVPKPTPKKIITVQKKKKRVAEGGC